jgi:L-lactate dehydrogenase complex protein LldE
VIVVGNTSLKNAPREVSLFVTCVCDAMYPEVGVAVEGILRHLGFNVKFPPGQTCCGQPAYNAGHHADAKKVAQSFITAMEGTEHIIAPSGSCAAMIRHTYLQMFAGDPVWEPRAQDLAKRCYEFSEYLVRVLGVIDLGAVYRARATIHHSCHMSRLLGELEAPLQLLGKVRGLELIRLQRPQDCCGFGGTFAVKFESISSAMAEQKVENAMATGADYLISTDLSCLLHIDAYIQKKKLPLKCMHIADVLASGWA